MGQGPDADPVDPRVCDCGDGIQVNAPRCLEPDARRMPWRRLTASRSSSSDMLSKSTMSGSRQDFIQLRQRVDFDFDRNQRP